MKQKDKQSGADYEDHVPTSLFCGEVITAKYEDPVLPEFRGNPLIECLPSVLSSEEVTDTLFHAPAYSPEYRDLPSQYRLLKLEDARKFFLPLSRDIRLYNCLTNMIYHGYAHRNPIHHQYYRQLNDGVEELDKQMYGPPPSRGSLRSRARGTAIVGTGGNGKTSSIENSLLLFPQVVVHSNYNDVDLLLKQVVWLKIDCPQDGSVRGLCIAFFSGMDDVLGTQYLKRYNHRRNTINDLLLAMARVAAVHSLGVLVIDEIQDLSQAKSGGADHLMNFFVHLENSIGVPFVLIGTPKALPLFKGEFRQARRASEQGDFLWKRLELLAPVDLEEPDSPPQPDAEWDSFIRQMWQYQYVKNTKSLPENILDEPVIKVLYNYSQGIMAVTLTIFLLTQRLAIESKVEEINVNVMRSATNDNQNLIKEMIDSIRLGRKKGVRGEMDFEPPIFRKNQFVKPPANKTGEAMQQDRDSANEEGLESSLHPDDKPNDIGNGKSRRKNAGNSDKKSSSVRARKKSARDDDNRSADRIDLSAYVKSPII